MNHITKLSLALIGILLVVITTGLTMWKYSKSGKTMAQNKIIAHNMPEHGLSILDQSDPSFNAQLASLIDVADDLKEIARQFSIIVVNNSNQNISSLTVRWEFEFSDGKKIPKTISNTSMDHLFRDPSFFLLTPGAKHPFSLLSITRPGAQRREIKSIEGNLRQAQHLRDFLAKSVKCNVTIDGVLFTDGTYIGPDYSRSFDRIQADINAKRDLVKEAAKIAKEGKSNAEIFGHVNAFAKITREELTAEAQQLADPMNLDHIYKTSKVRYAQEIMARKQNKGEQKTIESILNSDQAYISLVKK